MDFNHKGHGEHRDICFSPSVFEVALQNTKSFSFSLCLPCPLWLKKGASKWKIDFRGLKLLSGPFRNEQILPLTILETPCSNLLSSSYLLFQLGA